MTIEIPADVMEIALALTKPIEDEHRYGFPEVAKAIAKAIMDERERCAKIAEYWDGLDNVASQIRRGALPQS